MKKITALLGAAASLALAVSATAASATTFLFAFSGDNGLNGAFGSLEANANANGSYTAVSGTINAFGPVINGSGTLVANPSAPAQVGSPSGYFTFDDLLFPNGVEKLSTGGLLFRIGGAEINIFSNGVGSGSYTLFNNNGTTSIGNFSLSQVAAVPEPATWGLMIVGFGMIGAASRSRRVKTIVTYA